MLSFILARSISTYITAELACPYLSVIIVGVVTLLLDCLQRVSKTYVRVTLTHNPLISLLISCVPGLSRGAGTHLVLKTYVEGYAHTLYLDIATDLKYAWFGQRYSQIETQRVLQTSGATFACNSWTPPLILSVPSLVYKWVVTCPFSWLLLSIIPPFVNCIRAHANSLGIRFKSIII